MPTNLNALLRYKQIDTCLKSQYVVCTIEKLQEVCTEAMGEFRGIYKTVSERTIRDDIRVMRSSILGFNAPIKFEEGKYIYSDKEYSIFTTPVTEINLLKDILKILLEERNNITNLEIDKLLSRISMIVGEPIPFEPTDDKSVSGDELDILIRKNVHFCPAYSAFEDSSTQTNETIENDRFETVINEEKHSETLLLWDEIFEVL